MFIFVHLDNTKEANSQGCKVSSQFCYYFRHNFCNKEHKQRIDTILTCILIPPNKLQYKWTDNDTRSSRKCLFQIKVSLFGNKYRLLLCLHLNIATDVLVRWFLSNEKEYKSAQRITKLNQYLSFSF